MTFPIHMSGIAPLGQGGLGYHLEFIRQAAFYHSNRLPNVYCVGSGDGVQSVNVEPQWMSLCHKSPMRWLPSMINYVQGRYFDKNVASTLPRSPLTFHSFPGCAERTFTTVRKHGGTTILEAATTHVEVLFNEVQREHRKYRMGGSPFTRAWRDQVLREYDLADYIVVSSALQKASFIERGHSAEKILLAPLGIDNERFIPIQNQPSTRRRENGEKFRIIQVGQVSLLKGFQYLLQAIELLGDIEIEVVLCGGIGWRQIHNLVDSYRRKGITIRTVSGDPLPWLRSSHVCVHASIQDGFGLAPLEAMSTGLPTIVTKQTGAKDAVKHGANGYIVDSKDPQILAKYINKLKLNDDLRIAMGNQARVGAISYNAQVCIQHYANTLKAVWNAT